MPPVPVRDVNALLPQPPQPVHRFHMTDDGHPTALLNQRIAGALVHDFQRGAVDRRSSVCSVMPGLC